MEDDKISNWIVFTVIIGMVLFVVIAIIIQESNDLTQEELVSFCEKRNMTAQRIYGSATNICFKIEGRERQIWRVWKKRGEILSERMS